MFKFSLIQKIIINIVILSFVYHLLSKRWLSSDPDMNIPKFCKRESKEHGNVLDYIDLESHSNEYENVNQNEYDKSSLTYSVAYDNQLEITLKVVVVLFVLMTSTLSILY